MLTIYFLCLIIAIAMLIFLCLKKKFKLLNFESRITLLVTMTEVAQIMMRLPYLVVGEDWSTYEVYFYIWGRASERVIGWSFAS